MTADDLTVEGRRFRTRSDYEAALRDQKKIERIKAETDLNSPRQIYELFSELQSGAYRFESVIGTDFDDEIYEIVENLRKQGITAENAKEVSMKKSGLMRNKNQKLQKRKKADKNSKDVKENQTKSMKRKNGQKNLEDYDRDMQRQILSELKKQERRRKTVIIVASLVAVLCFGYFGAYYFFAERTNVDYEELAGLKGSEALFSESTEKKNDTLLVHKTAVKLPDVLDEYKTLYEKNKKLIGWLKIDDTNIDYPVMQTSNNEYYLDHNFNQEYDKNGSIFMDFECSAYPRSTNLILYGHHMKSGNMFGNLQKYAKESYGKEHALIQFDTIYEKATYQVMYVFRSQVYKEDDVVFKYYQFIDANSEAEFNYYMDEMAKLSLYETGVTANYGDSLLTLSTCDHSQEDGRFVVVAKRIR